MTALERACLDVDGDLKHAREREEALIREFKRRYHHYSVHAPSEAHELEWFSLMQHHGAPTRLLDWTYSIYVAAYFAIEHARKAGDNTASIWMLNATWTRDASADILAQRGQTEDAEFLRRWPKREEDQDGFTRLFSNQVLCAYSANPFRLNERLTLQRGVFVCPGDVRQPFERNLVALPGSDDSANLQVLLLDKAEFSQALEDLYYMNITRATLFPGLDGFAQSLGINLALLPFGPRTR